MHALLKTAHTNINQLLDLHPNTHNMGQNPCMCDTHDKSVMDKCIWRTSIIHSHFRSQLGGGSDLCHVWSRAQVLAHAGKIPHPVVPCPQCVDVPAQRLREVDHVPAIEVGVGWTSARAHEWSSAQRAEEVGASTWPLLLELIHLLFEFFPAVDIHHRIDPREVLAVLVDGITCGALDGIARPKALIPERSSESAQGA